MTCGDSLETSTSIIVPMVRTIDNQIDDFDALGLI